MSARLIVAAEDADWFRDTRFRDPGVIFRLTPGEWAALSQSSETFAVRVVDLAGGTLPKGAPELVFVKRYRYRTFGERLRGALRGTLAGRSRARFEYATLDAIRRRGVAAVRPIAYAELRKRGFLRACALVTEAERAVEPLDSHLRRGSALEKATPSQKRHFVDGLADFVRRMHDRGVVHGALFGRNVLMGDALSDAPRFVLLDPNPRGSIASSPASRSGRISDLADLNATARALSTGTLRLRFFRTYLRRPHPTVEDRAMIDAIERETERRAVEEAHRQTIAAAIAWLQERARRRATAGAEGRPSIVESLGQFVALLREGSLPLGDPHVRGVIDLRIRSRPGTNVPREQPVFLELRDGRVEVRNDNAVRADLSITTDEATFLAAINGHSDALEQARKGRILVRGDAGLLRELSAFVDAGIRGGA